MIPTNTLVTRRMTLVCLALAPLLEAAAAVVSPLAGTSNAADLHAVAAHQGPMAASVVLGLAAILLYVPALLGLAARTASHSRRLATLGVAFSTTAMLGFGGVRMIGAVQVSAVTSGLDVRRAARLFDHLGSNPVALALVLAVVVGTLLGFPLLAASAWRAGLSRVASGWLFAFPFVAIVGDDRWIDVATRLLLAVALLRLGLAVDDEVLPPHRLLSRRALGVVLVAAPVLEVVEQLLSPLASTSTRADLVAIGGRQGTFVASLLVGIVATALYVPAFLGLASRCVPSAPRASRMGGFVAMASMVCFEGVRAVQGIELQLVRDRIPAHAATAVVDGVTGNAAGVVVLVLFLGGSVVGLVALAVAGWKHGLPRTPLLVMAAFPVLDLALPGRAGTIASHAALLLALGWLAAELQRPVVVRRQPAGAAVIA